MKEKPIIINVDNLIGTLNISDSLKDSEIDAIIQHVTDKILKVVSDAEKLNTGIVTEILKGGVHLKSITHNLKTEFYVNDEVVACWRIDKYGRIIITP